MSDKEGEGNGTYIIVFPERDRRGEKRKPSGDEFLAVVVNKQEQRPNPRKKPIFELKGQVLGHLEMPCTVMDISLSGLKIRCKSKLQTGQEVGLHFLVPPTQETEQVSINPTCEVVWNALTAKEGYLVGLKIIPSTLTPKQQLVFQKFVDSLPDSPKARPAS